MVESQFLRFGLWPGKGLVLCEFVGSDCYRMDWPGWVTFVKLAKLGGCEF